MLPLRPRTRPRFLSALACLAATVALAPVGRAGDPAAISPPQPIFIQQPRYPYDLHRDKVEGTALVDVVVRADGLVSRAWPIAYTNKEFADQSVLASQEWRFRPSSEGDGPVTSVVLVPIVFSLDPQSSIGTFSNELARLIYSIELRSRGEPTEEPAKMFPSKPSSDRLWFELSVRRNQIWADLAIGMGNKEDKRMLEELRKILADHPPSPGFVASVRYFKTIYVSAPEIKR